MPRRKEPRIPDAALDQCWLALIRRLFLTQTDCSTI